MQAAKGLVMKRFYVIFLLLVRWSESEIRIWNMIPGFTSLRSSTSGGRGLGGHVIIIILALSLFLDTRLLAVHAMRLQPAGGKSPMWEQSPE
jgi:hypothetical protein